MIRFMILTVLCCRPAPVPCRKTVQVFCRPVCAPLPPPAADLLFGCRCIAQQDTWPEAESMAETLKLVPGLLWIIHAIGSAGRMWQTRDKYLKILLTNIISSPDLNLWLKLQKTQHIDFISMLKSKEQRYNLRQHVSSINIRLQTTIYSTRHLSVDSDQITSTRKAELNVTDSTCKQWKRKQNWKRKSSVKTVTEVVRVCASPVQKSLPWWTWLLRKQPCKRSAAGLESGSDPFGTSSSSTECFWCPLTGLSFCPSGKESETTRLTT